jgi:ubiquinol-cytochrome c reductase cytochrome b subunit
MPAYGKNLSPAETTALVSFLTILRPPGAPPAYDPSRVNNATNTTESSSGKH